ncbi:MAG: hypothetical protein LBB61_10655, partial [Treponema sp.]|nr:hypothetical protein [Treponema sp.]
QSTRLHPAYYAKVLDNLLPLPVCVPGWFHGPFLKLFRKNYSFFHDTSFFDHRLNFLSIQPGRFMSL